MLVAILRAGGRGILHVYTRRMCAGRGVTTRGGNDTSAECPAPFRDDDDVDVT